MSDTRELKAYKGYKITKINSRLYRAQKEGRNMVHVKSSLEELKEHIRSLEKDTY